MTDSNPYISPVAELVDRRRDAGGGTLEDGIRGNYRLDLGEVMSKAWALTRGSKGTLVLAMILFAAASLAASKFLALLGLSGEAAMLRGEYARGLGLALLGGIVAAPITAPLYAGIMIIGIKRAAGVDTGVRDLFGCFDRLVPLTITSLLMTLFVYVGLVMLVLPGLYLGMAFMAAPALVVDKGLGPWQALEASRKALTHSWFTVFAVVMVGAIVAALSALALGIGLIWTLPWFILMLGVVYHTVFGYGASPGQDGV